MLTDPGLSSRPSVILALGAACLSTFAIEISSSTRRACASGPSYSLHNENYQAAGREDKSQKLLTKTKKVRGLRSFLWVKPQAQTAQASFISQVGVVTLRDTRV